MFNIHRWPFLIGLLLIGLCLGIYLGFAFGNNNLLTARHNPILQVEPSSLDFGRVDAVPGFKWQIPITNTSDRRVDIAEIRTSCGCTKVFPASFSLSPGQSRSVQLTIDLQPKENSNQRDSESTFNVQVVPIVKDSVLPQAYWELTGTVVTRCQLDTTRLIFAGADAIRQHQSSAGKAVQATLDPGLSLIAKPHFDGDLVSVLADRDSDSVSIVVIPSSDRPLGWFMTQIDLDIIDRLGGAKGTLVLDVRGDIVSPIQAFPKSLALGSIERDGIIKRQIMVDHAGAELIHATASDENVHLSIDETAASSSIALHYQVTQLGQQHFTVLLHYRLDSGKLIECTVPVSYYGISHASTDPSTSLRRSR